MKSSIHLFYGIIIGILATLCMGLNKEEQKQFREIKLVSWKTKAAPSAIERLRNQTAGFYEVPPARDFLPAGQLKLENQSWDRIIASDSAKPDAIRKAGWAIIDVEIGAKGEQYFLIGK